MNRLSAIIKTIILFFLIIGGGFVLKSIDTINKQAQMLKVEKTELIKEKEVIEASLDKEKKESAEKGARAAILAKELAGLRDVKRIKELFEENQGKLHKLNVEYHKADRERSSFQQSNLTLTNKLTRLTNEFTRTLETVNELQMQVNEVKGGKFLRKHIMKLEKVELILKKREENIRELKKQNKQLFSDSASFKKKEKLLEKNIIRLEKDRSRLEQQVEKIKMDFNKQQREQAKLREDARQLTTSLNEKQKSKAAIDMQIERLNNHKQMLNERLDFQSKRMLELENELLSVEKKSRQIKKIESEKDYLSQELGVAQEKLKHQKVIITRLEKAQKGISVNEIPIAKSGAVSEIEGDLSKAYALYDTAKAQVVKFSEMLLSKEVELETSKNKISALEEELEMLRIQPEVSGDEKYAMLKDRIKMLNNVLLAKDEACQKKENEASALTQAKAAIEQSLEYQEQEYKNANILYAELKKQLAQSAELLARREAEVIENNREVLNLKSELILIQAEYKIKEHELKDLRMQQKKTIEDLSRVTSLNIDLQKQNTQSFNSQGSLSSDEEKQKADKLKKEIEMLLSK